MNEIMANLLGVEVSDIERADENNMAGEYPDDGRLEDEYEYLDYMERKAA